MLCIDLNELKITRQFLTKVQHFDVFTTDLCNESAKGIQEKMAAAFSDLKKNAFASGNMYEVAISSALGMEHEMATVEEAEAFLSWVNIIMSEFFKAFCTDELRKRERRLDVPHTLKNVKCSLGLLKKAVNYTTATDCFNLMITYKDLVYLLADEKEEVETGEFIHSADEAPELGGEDND